MHGVESHLVSINSTFQLMLLQLLDIKLPLLFVFVLF